MTSQIQEAEIVLKGGPDVATMERADVPAIWEDFKSKALKLKATAETLTVTDVSQVAEMKMARTTRLAFRDLRLAVESHRKEIGDSYLRKTQAINSQAKELKDLIGGLEDRLLEQEKFAERKEEERVKLLGQDRDRQMREHGWTGTLDLSTLKDEEFADILNGAKLANEAKLAEAKRIEDERIAKEKSDAELIERVRLESERFKAEAIEREKAHAAELEKSRKEREAIEAAAKVAADKARKEREAIEAKAKADRDQAEKDRLQMEHKAAVERKKAEDVARKEREAREAIEAKVAKDQEEARARLAKIEADRAAAESAPDREKLIALAKTVRGIQLPEFSTFKRKTVAFEIHDKFEQLAIWIEKEAKEIK